MKFTAPLIPAKLIKRYKRFLADVQLDNGQTITVHVPNSGAMTGLKDPGIRVWLSQSHNPKRKLPYTWEIAQIPEGQLVGVNTQHPNKLVEEAIAKQMIKDFHTYETRRREVPYSHNSRIDIFLKDPQKGQCYIEVKNVHLNRQPHLAEFPDAVTSRGAKHLNDLAQMVQQGHQAFMIYVSQRWDCENFALAHDIDPHYHEQFIVAQKAGVQTLYARCQVTLEQITLCDISDFKN